MKLKGSDDEEIIDTAFVSKRTLDSINFQNSQSLLTTDLQLQMTVTKIEQRIGVYIILLQKLH